MPETLAVIERQVATVHRRMWAELWLRHLMISVAIALAVGAVWVVAEPYAWPAAPASFRWWLTGTVAAIGLIAATFLAVVRSPAKASAALAIDERFGLRERVTTSLGLRPEDRATSAGQALLTDAAARLATVNVGERFPIQWPRNSLLVPVAAAVLTLTSWFYHPSFPVANAGTAGDKQLAAAEKLDIEKKLAELQPKPKPPQTPGERVKSEDLKRLEAKLEEIAKQPRDTTQQLRERIKDMTPLEDEVKKLERERSEKARMMQQQLRAKDKLMPNDSPSNGPAKDMHKALADGNLDKAKEEADRLAKMLQKNELTEQDKNDLAKQLNDLQKKLDDLSKQADKENQLKQLAKEGKLDAEALQRELDKLKADNEKLKDLQKLAQKLAQAEKNLKAGDTDSAVQALNDAAKQLSQMASESGELDELRDQLQKMQAAKDAMCKACEGDMDGQEFGNNSGEGEGGNGRGRSMNPGRNDMANGAGVGSGLRPDGDQGKIRTFDARQNAKFNAKGQKIFDGFVPGQAYRKKAGADMAGDIKQAAQEAPEAIEVQRIPKAARDMARGYFRNLGGQADDKPKSDDKK